MPSLGNIGNAIVAVAVETGHFGERMGNMHGHIELYKINY